MKEEEERTGYYRPMEFATDDSSSAGNNNCTTQYQDSTKFCNCCLGVNKSRSAQKVSRRDNSISMEIVCGAQTICWTKKSNTPGKERKKENQSVENLSASKDRS